MNKDAAMKRVSEILESHGAKILVSGCGCCGSPTVRFEYRGEKVTGDDKYGLDGFNIDMFYDT